ncbi:Ku protein [Streptomyces agglomeratus]|uniref:Ku protein n=1 Tax=Streptomyces agglomeratus TaxID=285458 RepID=UPI00099F7C6B|nr:Ku protein [Streptomyces agglomeratus]
MRASCSSLTWSRLPSGCPSRSPGPPPTARRLALRRWDRRASTNRVGAIGCPERCASRGSRYQKVRKLDGQVLDQSKTDRGYEVTKDTIVEITDEDLDKTPLPTAKAIDVVAFMPTDSIDPLRIGDSYYLAADGQVATPHGQVDCFHSMRWPDDIRSPTPFKTTEVEVDDAEVDAAIDLMEAMA